MMRNRLLSLVAAVLFSLSLVACDEQNPAVVDDDPPLNVTATTGSTVEIQGRTETGELATPEMDSTTGALDVLSHEHSELHEGNMMSAYSVVDIPNSGNHTIKLYTPASSTGYVHMEVEVNTESEAEYEIYEDSTTSANGTAITPYNRNRNAPGVAQVQLWLTPTITNLGSTRISWLHWGSGRGVDGEAERSLSEWVLKPSTIYIFRVTNFTNGANHSSIKFVWYRQQ